MKHAAAVIQRTYKRFTIKNKQKDFCLFVSFFLHFPYWTLREHEGAWFASDWLKFSCIMSQAAARAVALCNTHTHRVFIGRDGSVGIATGYGLDSPGIEFRWGARFSAPVRTVPGAHPASYTMGTGSFPVVRRPGSGVDHSPYLALRLKKEYGYTSTPLPPLLFHGLFWCELYP